SIYLAAVLHGALRVMRGLPFGTTLSLRTGFRRLLPVIGLAICEGLVFPISLALLIVPYIVLGCLWFVTTSACAFEHLGPFGSMRRSAALTKGHRWRLAGALLLLNLVSAIYYIIGPVVTPIWGAWATFAGQFLWWTMFVGFQAIVSIVAYSDLRAAKEGVD